ncbi:apolipoprotein N-acyltransferase [Curtobacterium flaccumfaciens pv. flaccumfaciens]|uniref:apolipoprotein N-acyltransferase n=1 Tax=Curtobacterium flaccumfaciens TaxID=2035 RepID=UPI00265A24C7|nr:apolipoprotein N-acyltransferase [Curtobacterium flaccumfaciens]MCS5510831.1 apolipoprotein N-acyltransferase [Curtobacterium flaccumfaciens pv. flaccumfaciens]MCX2787086.1 apolipoprotein N-acyltransferase [Curtobacterium flaccumfaciens pv. flaccumfaciens]
MRVPETSVRGLPARVGRGAVATGPFAALPLGTALPLAVVGGILFALAFPSPGWWFLAYPALACMLLAVMGQRARRAAWIGYLAGAAFWIPAISWAGRYLGPVPWFALALLEAAFFALGSVAIALAYRWVARVVPSTAGRVWGLPAVVAALWTGREWFSGSWPYGGFAWGRVGLSQSQGPFAHLAAYVGVLGLTFVVVYCVAVVVSLALVAPRVPGLTLRLPVRVATAGLLVAAVLAVPAWPTATSGTIRVESVQGNGPAGYFDRAEPGDVLAAQVAATDVDAKGVDLVVWPEAGAEYDPRQQPVIASALDSVVGSLDAPIVAGAITQTPSGVLHNTSFVWTADGWQSSYDKKRPVPFGEYVPDRWFFSKLAPSLIGLLQRDYTPGTKPNVLSVAGIRAGISICFDIVDDGLTADMVRGGAQVILAQTNNADFSGTDENLQQLEIARMRAIETGRSLVNISTVGASQVIDPSGRTIDRVPEYTATSMVTDVPLGTSTTPASILSGSITLLLSLGGLLVLLACAPWGRRTRS